MAHADPAVHHLLLHRVRQVEQAHQIGDMAAGFSDDAAQRFLAVVEFRDQLAIGFRFLNRVQILALNIFDERDFERFLLVKIPDDRRDAVKLSPLRSTPAPLARDDLKAAAMRADDDRLDHTALGDAVGQLLQRAIIEMTARLFGMGVDQRDFDALHRLAIGLRRTGRDWLLARDIAKQRGQAATQTLGTFGSLGLFGRVFAQAATSCRGKRAISSRARRI